MATPTGLLCAFAGAAYVLAVDPGSGDLKGVNARAAAGAAVAGEEALDSWELTDSRW
ncbi:MAG: hypothetical protein JOZ98_17740 [Solirubrobacterales bacterium]|nr:hypothetical protein [Solirubrobacterales bacterium]MBV9799027.1 hypothetical protein [Solirubrobacterales bacterium]